MEAALPTPEEKNYDGMNTVLAPVRWAKSLMQTVLIILLLIGVGLLYPIIQLVNNGHVTFGGFVVSVLTALFIFTFFYAPWYTVVGGIICFVVFYAFCFSQSFVDSLTGTGFLLFVFAFLAVGILQRYIRHRLFDPPKEPKPRQLSFVEQLNEVHLEECTRIFDAMSPEERESRIRRYGNNFLIWPECMGREPTPEQIRVSMTYDSPPNSPKSEDKSVRDFEEEEAAAEGHDLTKHYATLGVKNDSTPEEVKQAYRDLAKVWHPDRFDGGDTRLRKKAEETLKEINSAYARIQEALTQCPQHQNASSEKMPLQEAILQTQILITATTAKMMALPTMILPGLKRKDEIAAAIQECALMCKEGVSSLKGVISRVESEAPEYPKAELELSLAKMERQQAEMEAFAASMVLKGDVDIRRR
jgi:hypothetical protein